MTIIPQCMACRHLRRDTEGVMLCPAFGDRREVPLDIATNHFVHDKPHPRQVDASFLFEPVVKGA